MLLIKQVLCLNLITVCLLAEKNDEVVTDNFDNKHPFPDVRKQCPKCEMLVKYFKPQKIGCYSDVEKPPLIDANDRAFWIDLQRRCNGKRICNIYNFVLPALYFQCKKDGFIVQATTFDMGYVCKPVTGEMSVYSVTNSSTKTISTDLEAPKYLVHNNTSNDTNHIVCTLENLINVNITFQLLYVDWNMAPDCNPSQENVSIENTVYKCNNSTQIMRPVNFTSKARIEIYKQHGLVWIEYKVKLAHNVKCEFRRIGSNDTNDTNSVEQTSSTTNVLSPRNISSEEPSESDVLNIPIIVVPVVVLLVLLVICGLLLYRLCYSRRYGNNERSTVQKDSTHEYGEYSTINENYMTSPTTTESQGAYYDVDTEMLLLQSKPSSTAYKNLEKEPNTSAANVYQIMSINDDQTYAEVDKKPKSSQTQMQCNASSSQVSSSVDLSAKNDNVYAHLAHLQDKRDTDNIYNG